MAAERRILFVVGTRPEAVKLAPLVLVFQQQQGWDVRVCATAQHRQMLDSTLGFFGITPHYDLDLMRPGQDITSLTANVVQAMAPVLDDHRPDLVIVQGDTTTVFAAALAAFYRKIRVAHVEAGLRSGDRYSPFPEEMNRLLTSRLTDLHLAPTQRAAHNLHAEAIHGHVHVTGNTVIDALHWVSAKIEAEPALASGLAELEAMFADKRIIGVTSHRRENFGEGMEQIAQAIREIAARPDTAVIFPVHLNPNVRKVMNERLSGLSNVALIEPLDYPHFARLLNIAEIMLTDSGGVQEEAPALGKPVLVMRETTERPEGVEAGTARLVGTDALRIVTEISTLLDDTAAYEAMARAHNPFGDGHSACRIVELLAHEIGH